MRGKINFCEFNLRKLNATKNSHLTPKCLSCFQICLFGIAIIRFNAFLGCGLICICDVEKLLRKLGIIKFFLKIAVCVQTLNYLGTQLCIKGEATLIARKKGNFKKQDIHDL